MHLVSLHRQSATAGLLDVTDSYGAIAFNQFLKVKPTVTHILATYIGFPS